MIARIWHGYTAPEKASQYEKLLKTEIFQGIAEKKVRGYKGIKLLKRPQKSETEFITIMFFEDLETVKEFAGEDYEQAYVPESARKILSHFDARSQHYEIIHELDYE
jgi:heme-degrading monooxygenase HmoA